MALSQLLINELAEAFADIRIKRNLITVTPSLAGLWLETNYIAVSKIVTCDELNTIALYSFSLICIF